MKYIIEGEYGTELVIQVADDGLLNVSLRYSDENACSCAYIKPAELLKFLEWNREMLAANAGIQTTRPEHQLPTCITQIGKTY